MNSTAPSTPLSERSSELDSISLSAESRKNALRSRIHQHLTDQGFVVTNGRILAPINTDKDFLRSLHRDAVAQNRRKAEPALAKLETALIGRISAGSDINTSNIQPALVEISDRRSRDAALWRWCALHWSIPVSSGYGRRLRFLVVDRGNDNRVMGLIGLSDPVFSLGARDQWIGWDKTTRSKMLTNVMDAFVLGAIPPYAALRGGKLVALLATSSEVHRAFERKYGDAVSLISQRVARPRLAMVTTTSALGRSSVYNRLVTSNAGIAFVPVGYTAGSGDFHLSGSIYEELAEFARDNGLAQKNQRHPLWTGYNSGSPRSRRAVIECALQALDMDPKLLRIHGVRRQVFLASLVANPKEHLTGTEPAEWNHQSVEQLSEWWHGRWAQKRANETDSWRTFSPETWRLWASDLDAKKQFTAVMGPPMKRS